ncbi:MAG: tRNA preQ1(34) S-adenosylmethionine ribosyltransferase-isomerase QueA [Chloroflexi bacterium]|nr:tRNA preQ1(34) S-adenosylmethionine ribosyltransferase-isomerase QueA [Chloroflexota bacterium]
MKTEEFDYHLPQELIAQSPIEPRDASRLMVLERKTGAIEHGTFHDLPGYLVAGDVLVCNESRVIPARLSGRKVPTGGKVEMLLVAKRGERIWEVLTKGRKVRVGTQVELERDGGKGVVGEVIGQAGEGAGLIEFEVPIEPLLDEWGVVPLPPYIHEPLEEPERYQTIYARIKGSVAAPTAGLHFTPQLMRELEAKGVEFAFVTLHIGLDTFRPVRTENVEDHQIHSEYCKLSPNVAEQINHAKVNGRRIIAVGTTSVRVLETAARTNSKVQTSKPKSDLRPETCDLRPFTGWTELFIYPGYQFRAVDALITNFHLPRSTLLMLVAAFAGKELIDSAYREAIQRGYRFYSFGDAMLIL